MMSERRGPRRAVAGTADAGIGCSGQARDTTKAAGKPAASVNLTDLLCGGSGRVLITALEPVSEADLHTKPMCVVRALRTFRPTWHDLLPVAQAIVDGYIGVLIFADDDHAKEFEAARGPELIDRIIRALRALGRLRQ
jgi:hypothetical protein